MLDKLIYYHQNETYEKRRKIGKGIWGSWPENYPEKCMLMNAMLKKMYTPVGLRMTVEGKELMNVDCVNCLGSVINLNGGTEEDTAMLIRK